MSEWASSRRESMALPYASLDLFPGTVQLKLSNKHITFQDLCLSIYNLHYWRQRLLLLARNQDRMEDMVGHQASLLQ